MNIVQGIVQAINALHTAVWLFFLALILILFFQAKLRSQPLFSPFIDALNRVRMNVWMIVIIAAGVVLCCCGQKEQGGQLIIGAFAILRGEASEHSVPAPLPLQPPSPPLAVNADPEAKTS